MKIWKIATYIVVLLTLLIGTLPVNAASSQFGAEGHSRFTKRTIGGTIRGTDGMRDIVVWNGYDTFNLTDSIGGDNMDADVSPDGTQILFSHRKNMNASWDIWMGFFDFEGSLIASPVNVTGFDERWPSWTSNEEYIYEQKSLNGWSIYTQNGHPLAEGFEATALPFTEQYAFMNAAIHYSQAAIGDRSRGDIEYSETPYGGTAPRFFTYNGDYAFLDNGRLSVANTDDRKYDSEDPARFDVDTFPGKITAFDIELGGEWVVAISNGDVYVNKIDILTSTYVQCFWEISRLTYTKDWEQVWIWSFNGGPRGG